MVDRAETRASSAVGQWTEAAAYLCRVRLLLGRLVLGPATAGSGASASTR